jgi:hypothetical protein
VGHPDDDLMIAAAEKLQISFSEEHGWGEEQGVEGGVKGVEGGAFGVKANRSVGAQGVEGGAFGVRSDRSDRSDRSMEGVGKGVRPRDLAAAIWALTAVIARTQPSLALVTACHALAAAASSVSAWDSEEGLEQLGEVWAVFFDLRWRNYQHSWNMCLL